MSQTVQDGEGREFVRDFSVRCNVCGAELPCPDGEDPWAWVKDMDVSLFMLSHRRHAPKGKVGPFIKYVEKD